MYTTRNFITDLFLLIMCACVIVHAYNMEPGFWHYFGMFAGLAGAWWTIFDWAVRLVNKL